MNSSIGQHQHKVDLNESDEDELNDRSGKTKAGARKKGGYNNPWDLEVTGRAGVKLGKQAARKHQESEEAERKIEEGFERVLVTKPEQSNSPNINKVSKPVLNGRGTNKPALR